MGKKKASLLIGALALICTLIVGGFYAWRYYNNPDSTKVLSESTIIKNNNQADSQSQNTGLSITPAQNLTNLGQLGNVETPVNNNTSGTATDAYQNPTPETLKSYEQYKNATNAMFGDLAKGTGAEVKANSKVAIYYKGWLTDGTLFDQTRQDESGKLQPFMFTVGANEVIPGMEQGIIGMKVGGTRRIIIPAPLGYGSKAQGPVPANSMLVFDIQLVAAQ